MSTQKSQTLAIIGQGYVGLPLAMAAVDAGWKVIGIDNFEDKVAQINSGSSPIEDISDAQLKAAITKGAYKATTDFSTVAEASVVTICVPTPLDDKREPDLTFLRSAAMGLAPYVSNDTLIVSESTSYPGTLRDIIIPIIDALKPEVAAKIHYASAPERVNPGDQVWNQRNTPRLIGAIDGVSKVKALAFYESISDAAVSVSTPEIAEAAKLLENTFRLVNIALINEFAQLCSTKNIKIHEVIDAASTKPYGFMPFRPGVGVGGHCIPVDPLYLTWWARQNGSKAALVEAADKINHNMPQYIARRALSMIDARINNPKVLILGVTYKSGIKDTRETPVLELSNYLKTEGAIVAWHDPLVSTWEGGSPVELDWECDVVIVAVSHPIIKLESIIQRGTQVLDCTGYFRDLSSVRQI